jgi:hypothetical protein
MCIANRKRPMNGAQTAETPIQIAMASRMLIEATPKIRRVSFSALRHKPSRFIFG